MTEFQRISFSDWKIATGVEEQQSLKVTCRSCTSSSFRLKLFGMSTPFLPHQVL